MIICYSLLYFLFHILFVWTFFPPVGNLAKDLNFYLFRKSAFCFIYLSYYLFSLHFIYFPLIFIIFFLLLTLVFVLFLVPLDAELDCLEYKSRKSETPGVTGRFGLGVQNEAGQKASRVLPREHTGHSKHPLPTTQEKTLHMDITRWSTPKSDWLYSLQPKMEKLYTVSKNKTESWLWLRSWTPYCQIHTEIEESREGNRPFRYELNQIPMTI